MLFKRQSLVGLLSLLLIGCGGGDDNITDELDKDDVKKAIIEEVRVSIEPIDSMWVSGPENVITHWNEQILIPSVTGLLTLKLDENGYIDEQKFMTEEASGLAEVQGDIIATHQLNSILFSHYDGVALSKIYQTAPEELRQVPFTSYNNCFYWVALNTVSSPTSSVKQTCYVNGQFNDNSVIVTDNLINNLIALPDNRLITTSTFDGYSYISLYRKEGEAFEIKSTIEYLGVDISLDLAYQDNFLYADSGPSDIPDNETRGGLIRYNLADNIISDKRKLSDIITDNAEYDHIAVSPYGIILADDKKLKHFIITNGMIEKIVYAEEENSIGSIYVHDNYIVTVLRDPPSTYNTGEYGSSGVYTYPLNTLL
jgi:uncharacterized ubiquitin-like protein YukD